MHTQNKTSLIQTNWEQTLVQITESLNYRSVTENMFKEVIRDFTCLFRQYYNFEASIAYHEINVLVIKCKNVIFDISLLN
jgi:hypothetical protein